MILAKEFGDGVSDDLVMLFSQNTCIDVAVEQDECLLHVCVLQSWIHVKVTCALCGMYLDVH